MSRRDKRLAAMRRNPRGDWRIDDLKAIAERLGIVWRQPGTSHVTFVTASGASLVVPAHKPIKPIYVRRFVELVEMEITRGGSD